MTRQVYPSDLLAWAQAGIMPPAYVSLDTETSGLYVDEGARVSTVSVAWLDEDGAWETMLGYGQTEWDGGIVTVRHEPVLPDQDLVVVSMAWPFDQGVSGTGKAEDDGQQTLWPDAANLPRSEWDALLQWLRMLERTLVMHNKKFDVHMMMAGVRRWPGVGIDLIEQVVWDTQNVNSLIYPVDVLVRGDKGTLTPSTSLKPTSAWLWGDGETDEQKVIRDYLQRHRLPKGRWDLMPWDIIAKYADDDARKTIRLQYRQQYDIEHGRAKWLDGKDGRLDVHEAIRRRMRTTDFLIRLERAGLPFDVESAKQASQELKRRARAAEAELPFRPATLPMAKHFWFGSGEFKGVVGREIEPYAITDGGEPSVTEQIIDKMVTDGIEGAAQWRDLQKINTADSRWYEGWSAMVGADGRLRAGFRQNGTRSSRFSVERVQLQAIPHDYRLAGFAGLDGIPTPRTLIAQGVPEGYVLWELDLANAEARVAALFAGCRTMLRMFEQGEDLHGATAKALFGGRMFGGRLFDGTKADPQWDHVRNVAKRGNFSFIFGVGWQTFAETVERETGIVLSEAESKRIVREWNQVYPEYAVAIDRHSRKVEQRQRRYGRGWIETINGERRWFTKHEDTHKAFNQRVQTNLAQFGIDWWLRVEEITRGVYGDEPVVADGRYIGRIGMVMVIHDSMLLLLPDDEQGRATVKVAQRIGAEMWAQRFTGVPGAVDAKRWTAK